MFASDNVDVDELLRKKLWLKLFPLFLEGHTHKVEKLLASSQVVNFFAPVAFGCSNQKYDIFSHQVKLNLNRMRDHVRPIPFPLSILVSPPFLVSVLPYAPLPVLAAKSDPIDACCHGKCSPHRRLLI